MMSTSATSSTDEKKKKNYNGPDLISELPDSILHHILSFLDIKYVIPTSLLSRRWRFLWTSLPFLNINNEVYNVDCKYPREYVDPNVLKTDFTDFVHRVLLMRDGRTDISSCCFSYYDTDSDFYVKKDERMKLFGDIYFWIVVIIRSNVQVFDLRISSLKMPDQINLPHCLFNCESLTTLKLDVEPVEDAEPIQPTCNLPPELGMNLPALRVLLLRSLSIVGDVGKLVSSCPVLETFIFSKCEVNLGGKQLYISGSQLNKLEIEDISDYSSETGSLEYCKVKVFAPKLTSFISKSAPINDYTFVDTSSLVNADIETDEYSWGYYFFDFDKDSPERITWKKEFIRHLIKCFSGICNVRSLTLSAWLLTIITEAQADFRSLPMDPFCNLRILNLKTSLWRPEIHGITWLLEKCPALETLVLKMVKYDGYSYYVRDDGGWEAEMEPQCMMDHLKLVEIWDILTSVHELEFMKFLLTNATILEKIVVHTPKKQPPSDNIKLERFCEKLKTFPAASSMTKILFLSDAEPREHDADHL